MQIDPSTNKIICIYDSIKQAVKALGGLTDSSIRKCCNGHKLFNKAYGFKWAYVGTELNEEWVKSTTDVTPKRVEQIDPTTGEVIKLWEMIKDAAHFYGVTMGCITACCRGQQKTCAGFKWQYEDESLRVEYIEKPRRKRAVVQLDLDGNVIREWKSATDAAKAFGCTTSAIGNCCRGKTQESQGYKWRFAD